MPSGEERPNAFAAMTLNSAESKNAQIEREAQAIVFTVKKFHQYLFGHRFTLLTDHLSLSSGPKPAFPHCEQITCSALLGCYWYISTTSSRRSEQHCNADGLSRLPLLDTPLEFAQVDIFSFKVVQSAPDTVAQVKGFIRTDPFLLQILAWISHGRRGEMTDKFKPYLV